MTQRLSSRAPQALAVVHELLALCPDLEPVQRSYGLPKDSDYEQVCLTGNITDMAHEFASQGAMSRDESFQLELLIRVGRQDCTQQEALERAFEVLGIIDVQVLRPNPTLARRPGEQGPVLWSRITPQRAESGPLADGGYETELTCSIDCVARI